MEDWKIETSWELSLAEAARQAGNEGKARVCARRAAGYIVAEYFRRLGIPLSSPSAYTRLQNLAAYQPISPQVREIASHLMMRVNTDFRIPVEVDLVSEVFRLAEELLGESIRSR